MLFNLSLRCDQKNGGVGWGGGGGTLFQFQHMPLKRCTVLLMFVWSCLFTQLGPISNSPNAALLAAASYHCLYPPEDTHLKIAAVTEKERKEGYSRRQKRKGSEQTLFRFKAAHRVFLQQWKLASQNWRLYKDDRPSGNNAGIVNSKRHTWTRPGPCSPD